MLRDQFTHCAREPTCLLLDIDDPERALPFRFAVHAITEPPVDELQPPERVSGSWVSAIKPVEHIKFVGRPLRSGNHIDRRHSASRMSCENEATEGERAPKARRCQYHRSGKLLQAVFD